MGVEKGEKAGMKAGNVCSPAFPSFFSHFSFGYFSCFLSEIFQTVVFLSENFNTKPCV